MAMRKTSVRLFGHILGNDHHFRCLQKQNSGTLSLVVCQAANGSLLEPMIKYCRREPGENLVLR
jgi:hypothetical protein